MDVKEVRAEKAEVKPTAVEPSPTSELEQAPASESVNADIVSVSASVREDSAQTNDNRAKINSVISVVNVAAEATAEITKLVESIGGIVEQVSDESVPDNRRSALEQEANQLVEEIKKTVRAESSNGVRPLAGDKVRVEVEQKVRKSIEIVLPDLTKDNLGLSAVHFSPREAIIQTKVSIETARQRLNELQKNLDATRTKVVTTADELDVALQNKASSETSIRDIDEAFTAADSAHKSIAKEPGTALGSVGNIKDKALSLLD